MCLYGSGLPEHCALQSYRPHCSLQVCPSSIIDARQKRLTWALVTNASRTVDDEEHPEPPDTPSLPKKAPAEGMVSAALTG